MTDKELLELAAKAVDISGEYVENYDGDYYYRGETWGILTKGNNRNDYVWNPLTDDGDKYRLAKALDMEVNFNCAYVRCQDVYVISAIQSAEESDAIWEPTIDRAIVRAAAEIGKGMK